MIFRIVIFEAGFGDMPGNVYAIDRKAGSREDAVIRTVEMWKNIKANFFERIDVFENDEIYYESMKWICQVSSSSEIQEDCPYCGRTVCMNWNTANDGYRAFCPYCGERLMLCDECRHSEIDEKTGCGVSVCDFDSETDSCKHNREATK